MPARPPNFQAIALITSGTFNSLAALWIFADAKARRAQKPLFAALAVLLLGPLWLAFYMSDRPLYADEQRRGGFGWTWTQNFVFAWSASLVPWIVPVAVTNAWLAAPGALGMAIVRLLVVWFVPVIAATGVGQAIQRPDVIEPGGTTPAGRRLPLAGVSVLALIVTFVLLSALMPRENSDVPAKQSPTDRQDVERSGR